MANDRRRFLAATAALGVGTLGLSPSSPVATTRRTNRTRRSVPPKT